jgi:ferritin-like metal-binding protein YciE
MAKATGNSKPAASKSVPNKKVSHQPPSGNTEPALLELFKSELRDIYWAENQLVKTLPKMQEAATNPTLVAAIDTHLNQTKEHVTRIEQVFELLGETRRARKCDAMEGLTKEGEAVIEDTAAGTVARDAGIIIASQKVEHYEIAAYSGLIRLARILGLDNVVGILTQTLTEEQETDELLTGIAESDLNYQTPAQ